MERLDPHRARTLRHRSIVPVAFAVLGLLGSAAPVRATAPDCPSDTTLASGRPDRHLFASTASKRIRAYWCESYGPEGESERAGPYWERYPNGRLRTVSTYEGGRLAGPVTVRHDDGRLFLRGFLERGEWSGPLAIFHSNGKPWFSGHFEGGRLDGPQRTHFPDGALESESHYQNGREDGLARSFYPTAAGGRLRSEAHVEADRIVGRHRLLDRRGRLRAAIQGDRGPEAWAKTPPDPAAPRPLARDDARARKASADSARE